MKQSNLFKTVIIGGGASGLFLANLLLRGGENSANILLLERSERLGRKLSATGNGQGNVTNLSVKEGGYFSLQSSQNMAKAQNIVNQYADGDLKAFFADLGVLLVADERGRVYPASKQASALTDALRFAAADIPTKLGEKVINIKKAGGRYAITTQTADGESVYFADNAVLCAGGKAAKNFGTDGNAYALATAFSHTVTALYPSLVQLKTDTQYIKTLKGIRVNDGKVTACFLGKEISLCGDIIFTDYGVSGDAIFRISAYFTDKIDDGVTLSLDFLPNVSKDELFNLVQSKQKAYPALDKGELLFGIVNNQLGRAIFRRANGDIAKAIELVKAFPLQVTGSLGFDYAQVTKGGIPLFETDENLQSIYSDGLYFAGEILDVDGACGGFNLQWAYASAHKVADAILSK
jgi:predicted Rossmann fold flavoprotein